ncbi:MAG: response regulator transcription factor [Fusicatenibacter sp.]|nr:response regulator transcription factor [Fusicatenibacter sp.]
MFKKLVLENDTSLNQLFCRMLQKEQFQTYSAECVPKALELLEQHAIDLLITAVLLPEISGFELIRQLRDAKMDFPILIVTSKSDIQDKQAGFLSGADDYMVKPIDLQEMVLRVHALLRRARSVSEQRLSFGHTSLEYSIWTVTDPTGSQALPQKEFQLLYKLLSFPGQIFTRQQLLEEIWGTNRCADSHTLDVHISRLRERFRHNPDFTIVTVRGLGYRGVIRKQ